MVGNHSVMHVLITKRITRRRMTGRFHQCAKQISVIVIMAALQQRRDTFQPHTSINRLHIKCGHRSVFILFILHEHDVPNFNKAITVFIGGTGAITRNMRAVIIENLGAWAARSRWAHLPEIVQRPNTNDPVFRDTNLFPKIKRLVVCVVNRYNQTIFINTKFLGDHFPSIGNRLFLKIITKAKVAHHLEKRVVAGGISDVIKVVMLAPSADTFLGGRRPFIVARFYTGKKVLKLDHARVCEHQCGIIARDQRA